MAKKPILHISSGHIEGSTLRCPKCNGKADGHTGTAKKPEDGNVVVCLYCADVNKYAENCTKLVPLTEEEFKAFPEDFKKQILAFQKIAFEMIAADIMKQSFKKHFDA